MNREQVVARLTNDKAQKFIDQIDGYLKNFPHLPDSFTDVIVSIIPWLVAISGVLTAINGLQYILNSIGANNMALPFVAPSSYWFLMGVLYIVSAYLSLLAFPLLKEKTYSGWVLLFWNIVLSWAGAILTILFIPTNMIGTILGSVLGTYIVFEIKKYYATSAAVAADSDKKAQTSSTSTKRKKRSS